MTMGQTLAEIKAAFAKWAEDAKTITLSIRFIEKKLDEIEKRLKSIDNKTRGGK